MSKPLSQILGDGTLVDNTDHRARDGVFRRGKHGKELEFKRGNGWNNPWSVWPLMQKASCLAIEPSDAVLRSVEYEHNTGDPFILLSGFDPLNFTLTTGNLIGSMKFQGYTLRVSSRFGDEFLKYIIADADGFVELPDHGGMDKGGYEWLLIYLWVIKLKKAFRLGLPKSYESRTEPLTQVRGRLDPVDYYLNRERALYSCTYREHSYDNPATRLIARTLEHLDSGSNLRDCHSLNQTFQSATAGRHHSLESLLAAPPVRNPYYADYNPVMTLAKRILRNELTDFGNKDQTTAFFFDVSMLFEYFIRKLLRRAGMILREKSTAVWTTPRGLPHSGRKRELQPDLVFDHDERTFVFDVKYKSFDFSDGVKREDMFQLHTYIGQAANEFEVAGCGFIYPIRESRWNDVGLESCNGVWTSKIKQGGREIPFHVAFLMVPERGKTPEDEWPAVFQKRFKTSIKEFLLIFSTRLQEAIIQLDK